MAIFQALLHMPGVIICNLEQLGLSLTSFFCLFLYSKGVLIMSGLGCSLADGRRGQVDILVVKHAMNLACVEITTMGGIERSDLKDI
ncbi:hypothetical protein SDJN02_16386 [Cucurbita argyrosperma subsp. argyrosperma]|nr:hypothetical protein SDJN02_16386 [Cucurbita argyrosperma subsp. argyrosperma]